MLALLLIFSTISVIIYAILNAMYRYYDSHPYAERMKLSQKKIWNLCFLDESFLGAAVVGYILSVFLAIILLFTYQPGIEEKIIMYQEENTIIEMQLANLVQNYMEYEKDVVFKVAEDGSTIQLISLYPELSADELVKAQMNTYLENNKEIKNLKNSQINQSYWRWWAYFGE